MRLQISKGLQKMYRRPDLLNNSPIVVQIETFALSSKQNLIGYGTILHCSLNQNFRTVGGCCDKPRVDTHSNNGLFLLLLELPCFDLTMMILIHANSRALAHGMFWHWNFDFVEL